MLHCDEEDFVVRKFLFLIKTTFANATTQERWSAVRNREGLPPKTLKDAEDLAQRLLIVSVFETNSFYRKLYSGAGGELAGIVQEGWFEKLPVVTKAHLREHFEEMTDLRLKRFRKISTTGGSTGTPTRTGYDGRIPEMVYSWRLQSWFGIHPWDDHAYVWRVPKASRLAKLKNATLWWPTRHLELDASFMTEALMMDFIRRYNRLKPT